MPVPRVGSIFPLSSPFMMDSIDDDAREIVSSVIQLGFYTIGSCGGHEADELFTASAPFFRVGYRDEEEQVKFEKLLLEAKGKGIKFYWDNDHPIAQEFDGVVFDRQVRVWFNLRDKEPHWWDLTKFFSQKARDNHRRGING